MPSNGRPEEALVTVATFEWLMQADVARSRLAACGIEAHLPEEFVGTVCWHYAKAIGGLRLQVGGEDFEDARAVLEEPQLPVDEPILDEMEAKAERFLRTAVFATVAFPLVLYALWLIFDLFTVREQLTARARRQAARGATLLALAVAGPAGFAILHLLGLL